MKEKRNNKIKNIDKKKLISVILVFVWMLFIFVMSSFPADESSSQSGIIVDYVSLYWDIDVNLLTFIVRKCAHFFEYLVLGILICNCNKYYKKSILLIVGICILYSISDEIHQLFVIGRACRIYDVIIDSVGSIIGVHLFAKIKNLHFKKIMV